MNFLRATMTGRRGRLAGIGIAVASAMAAGVADVSAEKTAVVDLDRSDGSAVRAVPSVSTSSAPATAVAREEIPHDELRDPFWPQDYVPPQLSAVGKGPSREALLRMSEAEWVSAEKQLTIQGASRLPIRDGTIELCALINGERVRVGGTVSTVWNGKTFRWRVVTVSMKTGPVFERILPLPAGKDKQP